MSGLLDAALRRQLDRCGLVGLEQVDAFRRWAPWVRPLLRRRYRSHRDEVARWARTCRRGALSDAELSALLAARLGPLTVLRSALLVLLRSGALSLVPLVAILASLSVAPSPAGDVELALREHLPRFVDAAFRRSRAELSLAPRAPRPRHLLVRAAAAGGRGVRRRIRAHRAHRGVPRRLAA